jgi:hypothetical protein
MGSGEMEKYMQLAIISSSQETLASRVKGAVSMTVAYTRVECCIALIVDDAQTNSYFHQPTATEPKSRAYHIITAIPKLEELRSLQ